MNKQKYFQNRISRIILKGMRNSKRPSQILEALLQDRTRYTETELIMFEPFKVVRGIKRFSTYSEKWTCK